MSIALSRSSIRYGLRQPTVVERSPNQVRVVVPPYYAALWFPAIFVIGGIVGLASGAPSPGLFLAVAVGLALGVLFVGYHATIVADRAGIRADNRFLGMRRNVVVVPFGDALSVRHQAGQGMFQGSIRTPWKLVVVLKTGDIEYLAGGSSQGGEQPWADAAAALNDFLQAHREDPAAS